MSKRYYLKIQKYSNDPVLNFSSYSRFILAFADYTGGLNGIECSISNVVEGIEAVHRAGGLVKVAYGGALYSMSMGVNDE